MKLSFLHKNKVEPETLKIKVGFLGNDADSDWKTLFFSGVFLGSFLAVLAGIVFVLMWTRLRQNTFVPASFDFIDKESLATVEDLYEIKALEYDKWLKAGNEFSDPSL